MKENKLVTWEMFQKYHEQLMDYITSRDGLTVDGEEICPENDVTITNDECENCDIY